MRKEDGFGEIPEAPILPTPILVVESRNDKDVRKEDGLRKFPKLLPSLHLSLSLRAGTTRM